MGRETSLPSADMVRTTFLEKEAHEDLVEEQREEGPMWEARAHAEEVPYVQITGRWAGQWQCDCKMCHLLLAVYGRVKECSRG